MKAPEETIPTIRSLDQSSLLMKAFLTYYQRAVRDYMGYPDASWYLDIDSSGVQGITYDLKYLSYLSLRFSQHRE